MPYDYSDIIHRWYEELKPLFLNYFKKHYPSLDYDEIMEVYDDTWLDVRENIRQGRVADGTKWRPYIFKIGSNKINKKVGRAIPTISIDGDEEFNYGSFALEKAAQEREYKSVYEDPELQAVLAAELTYVPEPCNKILTSYYFDNFSMSQIADMMNYSGPRSAITTKNRCLDKLKTRMMRTVKMLGII